MTLVERWGPDTGSICRRISGNKSPFKILVKTFNESDFLLDWIAHHTKIVGADNLIIADNSSTDESALSCLSALSQTSTVFQFEGFHNFIQDRGKYPELYEALCGSCEFFMFLDVDERLVWVEDNRWLDDERIVSRLIERKPFKALPAALIDNFPESRSKFSFPKQFCETSHLVEWGKPVISSAVKVGGGDRIHNCQFPGLFDVSNQAVNLLVLHLTRLNSLGRMKANRAKLLKRGIIDPDLSFEEISVLPLQAKDPNSVADRCIAEIASILRFMKEGKGWGPKDEGASISMDGNELTFGSREAEIAFKEFVTEGGLHLSEVNSLLGHALKLAEQGRTEEALAVFQEGRARFPNVRDTHGDPAFEKENLRLLLRNGRWDEAYGLIPHLATLSPEGWFHILFARALDADGEATKARDHWERFASTRPHHPEALSALAGGGLDDLQPRMSVPERNLFSKTIQGQKCLLEFGAGGSTSLAAKSNVSQIVSVESDQKWLDVLSDRPEMKSIMFFPVYVNIGETGNWGFPTDPATAPRWPAYYTSVWDRLVGDPTVVLVDGRFRVACALMSILNCRPDTKVMVHDFWDRPYYHDLLKYADCIERADTLGVFARRDDIDWREVAKDIVKYSLDPR